MNKDALALFTLDHTKLCLFVSLTFFCFLFLSPLFTHSPSFLPSPPSIISFILHSSSFIPYPGSSNQIAIFTPSLPSLPSPPLLFLSLIIPPPSTSSFIYYYIPHLLLLVGNHLSQSRSLSIPSLYIIHANPMYTICLPSFLRYASQSIPLLRNNRQPFFLRRTILFSFSLSLSLLNQQFNGAHTHLYPCLSLYHLLHFDSHISRITLSSIMPISISRLSPLKTHKRDTPN